MLEFGIYHSNTHLRVIIIVLTIRCTRGCGPVHQGREIREILQGLNQITSVTNYATVNLATGENPNELVKRQSLGRTYLMRHHLSHSQAGKYLTAGNLSVIWKHNGDTLISAEVQELPWSKNDSSNMFGLNITGRVDLKIYNMSRATSGKHQITLISGDGESLSVTTTLRVRYNPRDVFHAMKNLTGVTGDRLEFDCSVESDISQESDIHHRFVWRHGNNVVHGPENHPLQQLVNNNAASDYSVYYTQVNQLAWQSTLTIPSLSQTLTGRYECWFKPDMDEEEWLVQSAYLRLE